jgi:hypothetical protein
MIPLIMMQRINKEREWELGKRGCSLAAAVVSSGGEED